MLSLHVCKYETRRKSAVKLLYFDDIVIKLATSLTHEVSSPLHYQIHKYANRAMRR